jgi:pentatricopeptide repeat protein
LDEAITALKKAASLTDDSPALLGTLVRAYAQAGHRKEARKLLDELKRRQQEGYVSAAAFVEAYLGLAETDQAFAWLERAYQEHSIIMQVLKVDPLFDPIRRDPRFVDLVRRVGLT